MKNDACKLADHEERRGAGSLCPRSLAQLTDIPFFFSMDEETSDATIQSESPGPRAPADRGPILNSARACCLPDCRAADVAVVAFCVEINQCVGCRPGSVERRGTGIATPASRRRVDGVHVDATIQHERAVKV